MNAPSSNDLTPDLLSAAVLAGFRERAPQYDGENRFFAEDFAQLREAGYLAAVVPQGLAGAEAGGAEAGGAGLSLSELLRAQRRLAAHAPATALGVNMHLVWTQVARFLHDRGDHRLDWVLRDAAAGEVFAFGISEAKNDAVLLDSFTQATPHVDGGYLVSGTKVFTTLSPVWTRLGVHARDESAAAGKELVFGFVRREGAGFAAGTAGDAGVRSREDASTGLAQGSVQHPGTWNPLGMRATQSWNTTLEGVRILEEDVAARMPAFDGQDPLVLGIFSSFSLLTASVYAGIADRALELATASANAPANAPAGGGEPGLKLDDPDTAARLTEAVLAHRRALDALELLARDVDEQRSRSDWFLALAAARNQVCDEAMAAVDVAMRFAGSRGFQADSELARLTRDVRAGLFHPSSAAALARTVRGTLLNG